MFKTIDLSVGTRQGVTDTLRFSTFREHTPVRITVHHDGSYNFQSRASLDVWSPQGWLELTRVVSTDVVWVDTQKLSDQQLGQTEARLLLTATKLLNW